MWLRRAVRLRVLLPAPWQCGSNSILHFWLPLGPLVSSGKREGKHILLLEGLFVTEKLIAGLWRAWKDPCQRRGCRVCRLRARGRAGPPARAEPGWARGIPHQAPTAACPGETEAQGKSCRELHQLTEVFRASIRNGDVLFQPNRNPCDPVLAPRAGHLEGTQYWQNFLHRSYLPQTGGSFKREDAAN